MFRFMGRVTAADRQSVFSDSLNDTYSGGFAAHQQSRTFSVTGQEVRVAKTDIAGLLALAAALMIGIGDVLQQQSAQQVTDKPVGTFALFGRLLRDRRWWAGTLVAAAGFGLQAAALGFGSVVLVQALLVTSLLFSLVINAKVNHRRITRWQGIWAVLLAAAVTVVVTVGNPQAGNARGSLQAWAIVAAVMGPALILCLVGARTFSGSVRALLLGLVSGSLWGLFSVLMKGVVDQLGHGIPALLRTPEVYVWSVLAIAATAWEQSAFRAGPLTASLPAVTVSEPIVASVLGITVLGETLNTNNVGRIALGVSAAVMAAATVALARSQAAAAPQAGDDPLGGHLDKCR
jgi:drug/metabolite transporter (DMT)-like permease